MSNKDADEAPGKGFAVEVAEAEGRLACRDVRGFREAAIASRDPEALLPARLVLVVPDFSMDDWLALWAVDVERTRRTVTITRLFDGKRVTVVATLASYGNGVETSLAIESLQAEWGERTPAPFRSPVHEKATIVAALAAARDRARLRVVRDDDELPAARV